MILPADPAVSAKLLMLISFISAPLAVVLAAIELPVARRFPTLRPVVRWTSVLLIVICFVMLFGYAFLASSFGLR